MKGSKAMPPGVQRTRPEAPCLRHTSPWQESGLALISDIGEARSATIEIPRLSPVCRPAASAGFAILEFWCSASRRWSRARAGLRVQRNAARWRDQAQASVTTLKILVLERFWSWKDFGPGKIGVLVGGSRRSLFGRSPL